MCTHRGGAAAMGTGGNPTVTAGQQAATAANATAANATAANATAANATAAATARLTTSQKDSYVRQLSQLVSSQLFRSNSRTQRQIDRIEQEIRDTYGDTALRDIQSEVRRAMRSIFNT